MFTGRYRGVFGNDCSRLGAACGAAPDIPGRKGGLIRGEGEGVGMNVALDMIAGPDVGPADQPDVAGRRDITAVTIERYFIRMQNDRVVGDHDAAARRHQISLLIERRFLGLDFDLSGDAVDNDAQQLE